MLTEMAMSNSDFMMYVVMNLDNLTLKSNF